MLSVASVSLCVCAQALASLQGGHMHSNYVVALSAWIITRPRPCHMKLRGVACRIRVTRVSRDSNLKERILARLRVDSSIDLQAFTV